MSIIKRMLLILAVLALTMSTVSARKLVQLGVKAGVTVGEIDFNRNVYGDYNVHSSARTGFHVGLISRINLLMLHLQPELYYSHNRYKLSTVKGDDREVSTVRINALELPLLVGVKIAWFRIQAGPVFNLMTDTSVNHKGNANHTVSLDKSTISYMLGIGFDISKLNFDIRYSGQFKRPRQYTGIGSEGFDARMKFRQFMFSAAYLF